MQGSRCILVRTTLSAFVLDKLKKTATVSKLALGQPSPAGTADVNDDSLTGNGYANATLHFIYFTLGTQDVSSDYHKNKSHEASTDVKR